MRIKKDYMGNGQLLPAYNIQVGVADEYIAVLDVNQYRSDMDCFVPLLEKFHGHHGIYPKYPVADAGYGSFNNYLYCSEHEMEACITKFHNEVKERLTDTRGFLLRRNRAIQAESAFGVIKNNRGYDRIVRRGLDSVKMEVFLVSIGFNLYKYHRKQQAHMNIAV